MCQKRYISLTIVFVFCVFSCFAVKSQDVSVLDDSTVTSFPLAQPEFSSEEPDPQQAASISQPDATGINEACLFKGGTCAPYFYDSLYDLLDWKSLLALGATSKTERTHVTRVLMRKDPRRLHMPQWQDGPVPQEELETYQWTDVPMENTFLNYLLNRSVWEAQRQVFRTIYRIEATKTCRRFDGKKICQGRYITALQNIVSRFDDPRFKGMESVSKVKEVFVYLSYYLAAKVKNHYQDYRFCINMTPQSGGEICRKEIWLSLWSTSSDLGFVVPHPFRKIGPSRLGIGGGAFPYSLILFLR